MTMVQLSAPPFALLALLALACAGNACSANEGDASGTYVIEFPSSDSVLWTESVDIEVYDAADDTNLCITLTEKVRTKQALPPALNELPRVDPCALAKGDGALRLSKGARALLVRANRAGAAFLVGCARFEATAGFETTVVVSLLPDVAAPPPPACASLQTRCQGEKC